MPKEPSNVEFVYMYRDGANYKQYGSVVFANPNNVCVDEVTEDLHNSQSEYDVFNAAQVGLPELFSWDGNLEYDAETDHCWHEFFEVRLTEETVTDGRTLREFVEEFKVAGKRGWEEFDVEERIKENLKNW